MWAIDGLHPSRMPRQHQVWFRNAEEWPRGRGRGTYIASQSSLQKHARSSRIRAVVVLQQLLSSHEQPHGNHHFCGHTASRGYNPKRGTHQNILTKRPTPHRKRSHRWYDFRKEKQFGVPKHQPAAVHIISDVPSLIPIPVQLFLTAMCGSTMCLSSLNRASLLNV